MIRGDKERFFSSMQRAQVFILLIVDDIGHAPLGIHIRKSPATGLPQPRFALPPPKSRRQGGARRFFNRRLACSPPRLARVPTLCD